jgi:putative membrane protein
MWDHMGSYGGWWGFGPLPMLLFWVLVVAGIVALAKYLFGRSGETPRGKSALDILKAQPDHPWSAPLASVPSAKERYARGEIGKEEFEQKKRDIEG